ncbi:MAG: PAS domain-containing protein, partial [Candidatus Dormibacteraeota bacterium]|nr:PAS domain-containing protein [Candidatus Dormibacteraeota bacterium]
DEVTANLRPVVRHDVEWVTPTGDQEFLDVNLMPLDLGGLAGVLVSFARVTDELAASKSELESAYEELQSTVEELETTNEELQSANEELETMNEELQSTNGELQAINSELQQRGAEVDRPNSFVESVLGSLDAGVIALDTDLRIVVWNDRSADLWGLRDSEVLGQPLLAQDIGLPVAEIAPGIRACLAGDPGQADRVVTAMTRRGRTIRMRVTCTPVRGSRGIEGVVVLAEDITGGDGHEPAASSESQAAPTS